MQVMLDIPPSVARAAEVKAKRVGSTPEKVLRDAFNRFLPAISSGELAYNDIAMMENCHVTTVKRWACSGQFGKLIRRSQRTVRVPLKGYLTWKEGRGK